MKIWKIFTVLLAVLLLAGCVGCVSGATIDSATITLKAPATGEAQQLSYSSGISVVVSWSPYLSSTATFEQDTLYSATIRITNSSGNTLANSVTVKLNGESKTYTPSGGEIYISKEFPKTAKATTISEIECSINEPVAADTPVTSVTFTKPTAGLQSKVTWDTTDKKFVLGKKYTAKVEIQSTNDKAYPLGSSVTLKLNKKSITNFKQEGNKITFSYTFDETQPKGIADILSFTVNAPVVGEKPDTYLRVNAHTDKIAATAEWDTTTVFQADIPYTTTITVYAKEGYVIKEGATAKVNGNPAILNWISDTKAIVTYRFAQIDSVSTVNVNIVPPATGELAKTTATSVTTFPENAANSATIKWTPALTAGEFDAGVEYSAEVTIPISGSNIVFDKDTIVYINGDKATVASISTDAKTLKATYLFPKTTFIPNPIEIIKELYNLLLAFFNPASYGF